MKHIRCHASAEHINIPAVLFFSMRASDLTLKFQPSVLILLTLDYMSKVTQLTMLQCSFWCR